MNTATHHVVENLRRDGISLVEPLSSGEVGEILVHLSRCRVYNAHVKVYAQAEAACPADAQVARWPAFTVDMGDIVAAPHFFEAALESYPVACEFFGEKPFLYSMNAFFTQPGSYDYGVTHGWHCDGDDRKQVVLFAFGTDIERPENGAHIYVTGTQGMKCPYAGQQWPAEQLRTITGPAGTMFMADTSGFHQGLRPDRLRLLLWARWGVSLDPPPESYVWDKLAPVPRAALGSRYPSDPLLQEAVSLVVR